VTRISDMRNLGIQMEHWLAEADIANTEDLRTIGAAKAWTRLRFIFGPRISIIALYAMEAAILGCDWRELPAGTKNKLHLLVGYNPSEAKRKTKMQDDPVRGPATHLAAVNTDLNR
jgi:DNA transformation protein and related proteins